MNTQTGMTLKQMGRHRFYVALEAYEKALRTGENFIAASINIHAAKGNDGVTRDMIRMVNRTRRIIEKENVDNKLVTC